MRTKAAHATEAVIQAYWKALNEGADESSAGEQARAAYRSFYPKVSGDVLRRVVAAIVQFRT
jgi:hypothetical protein